jgi:16S rRNA processing protein RimM
LTSRSFDELVAIGRIDRPQGRRGEVVVTPFSDRPDRFPKLERAFVPGPGGTLRELAVTSRWPHKGRWVLKVEGVDSIDDADGLRGLELRIGEEELAPLPEGSYYDHQLRGLEVVDADSGERLGVVRGLIETGGVPVLAVDTAGGESLIPLAERFVRQVDLASGRMLVRPPELEDAEA